MLHFPHPVYANIILIPIVVLIVYRGILPGFTQLDTDFPNYYTAGRVAAEGKDIAKLYDDNWFQQRMYAEGIHQLGRFSPFPPPTALVFIPFAQLSPLTALQVMTILNCMLLLASLLILSRCVQTRLTESAFIAFISGIGLINCFRFGQMYIAVSFSIILGYYFFLEKKPILAGISLGLLSPVKYFPIIFVLYFVFKKEWRLVFAAILTIAIISVVSVCILGWDVHKEFVLSILGSHLLSNRTLQDPFSSTYQSFDSLLRRLLVSHPDLNPHPILDSQISYQVLKWMAIVGILMVSIRVLAVIQRSKYERFKVATSCSILGIVGLLIAPATATYHYVLLWLPVALLLDYFRKTEQPKPFWIILTLYTLIGFIPYSFFHQFDGQGLFTLLAYPRLFLMCVLFTVSLRSLRNVEGATLANQ